MEVEIIRKKEGRLNSKGELVNRRLRVAAYARVSTDQEEQQSSFESQQKYYLEKIQTNPKWSFVEVYADEGISGTQAIKRENFMRMVRDALDGKIDLILTKSISRFARNTLDTLKYVRELRSKNIGIIFEEENINTLDMAGELLLTVLSSVAQQESETLSSHIKLGFRMKRERGELIGFNSCYGYEFDNDKNQMLIKEDEAKIVRMIFRRYLDGYGSSSIAKIINEMGLISPMGKDHWGESTVLNILKNEKYIGDVCQGKSFTVDSITHRRVLNKGEEDKFYIKDHHEPIISKEDFEKVQEIMQSRSNSRPTGRKMQNRYVFSGRFRCGFCGKTYIKKSLYKKRPAWDCMSVAKNARELCENSKLMHEDVIKSCFMEAYHLLTSNYGFAMDEFMKNIHEAIKGSAPNRMKAKYETERDETKKKLSKLVDLFVEEKVDETSFEKKHNLLQNRINELEDKISKLDSESYHQEKVQVGIDRIRNEIEARAGSDAPKLFDDELFDAVVDYGIIGGYNEILEKEPYMIRFICKNGYTNGSRGDITEDMIVQNNRIGIDKSIYVPVIDFVSNQHFFVYVNESGRLKKTLVTKVRVRVEVEK